MGKTEMNSDIEKCPLCGEDLEHVQVHGYRCPQHGHICVRAWGYE